MLGIKPRRRLRLQVRILVSFVVLLSCVITLVIMVVNLRQRHIMMDLNEDRGLAISRSLAAASSNALLSYNYVALQQLTERAAREDDVRYVIVLDKEGKVAGYSERPGWQGKELDDAVSRAAAAADEVLVQEVGAESAGGHEGLDFSVPVYVEGSSKKWGTVRIGLSLDSTYAELNRTRLWVLGLGVAVLALAIIVARVLAGRITGPIKRLVKATGELAQGNFDYRVGIRTGDEIEDLSNQFDRMARQIREKQTEVEDANRELAGLNASLEEKVEKRTRALTEAEEKYRLLVEQSPNPICIVQNDRLVFCNEAFSETFGYSEEELFAPDFDLRRLVDPEHHVLLAKLRPENHPENRGAAVPFEIVARNRGGKTIHLDVRSTVISYEGRPALEAILVDVTEQRDLQERVVSYERLRALGEMASGVAHDFNNVLGAILARAQLLQKHTDDPDLTRGLRTIEKAAQDGGETVKRIQEFTRLRTDRDFASVSLNTVLEDVLEITRNRWHDEAHRQGKSIELVRNLTGIQDVEGNLSELREAFTNLILNAVDAIAKDGVITVCTYPEGDKVVATITDTGQGMSEEVQRRLFDPFFTTKGNDGNGLGMSIVYGIVRRHGGKIEVVSNENDGTCFQITLPALVGEEAPPPPDAKRIEILPGSGRILVVDDEEDIRTLVADILTDAGYDVKIARDGAEAIEKVQAEAFDLVVTDLGMPNVSGWDVARETRRAQPEVKLVLLTGWGASLDADEVGRHGIDITLKKPFEMNELLRAVQELMHLAALKKSA